MKTAEIRFEPRFGDRYPSQQTMLETEDDGLLIAYRDHLLRELDCTVDGTGGVDVLVTYRERILDELREVERLLQCRAHAGILCG
jgi:hypothetical protein